MEMGILKKNEDGTVLVVALIMLVLLTVIGISASTTSTIEIRIAGNEKFHKMAFYAADGGTEAGAELLEQSIEDRGWSDGSTVGSANILNGDFWANLAEPAVDDVQIPNLGGGQVNLRFNGDTELSTGSALQIASGYEGKGKGVAGGGAYVVYNIRSFASGQANSKCRVRLLWRHLI